MKPTLTYSEMESRLLEKGFTKKQIKKILESGELKPFVKNPDTGNYCRYRIIKINKDGSVEGEFEH